MSTDDTEGVYMARVLVIDDDFSCRTLLKQLLESTGHEVELASNGRIGIELFRSAIASPDPFELVITDLKMPGGIGGQEVEQVVHELSPQMKVVIFSGSTSAPEVMLPQEYGFVAVLRKPTVSAVMRDQIEAVLRHD